MSIAIKVTKMCCYQIGTTPRKQDLPGCFLGVLFNISDEHTCPFCMGISLSSNFHLSFSPHRRANIQHAGYELAKFLSGQRDDVQHVPNNSAAWQYNNTTTERNAQSEVQASLGQRSLNIPSCEQFLLVSSLLQPSNSPLSSIQSSQHLFQTQTVTFAIASPSMPVYRHIIWPKNLQGVFHQAIV